MAIPNCNVKQKIRNNVIDVEGKFDIGSVWIDLFELIYRHKNLWDCLGEFKKTTHDMFVNCIQLISIS